MNEITHTAGTVTVAVLSTNKGESYKNPNDVDFMVKYPEGYTGNKIMPEGVVVISKEAAEKFSSLGIGSVVGSEEKKPAEESNQPPAAKSYDKLNKEQLKAELTERGIQFSDTAVKADLVALLTANDLEQPGSEEKKPAE